MRRFRVGGIGHARTHDAAQNVGPARVGVLFGLDGHERAGLAEYEPIAVTVERPAGALRIVVSVGQHDAHLREPGDRHRFDLGLDAVADRDVGLAEHDLAPRVGDRLRAGSNSSQEMAADANRQVVLFDEPIGELPDATLAVEQLLPGASRIGCQRCRHGYTGDNHVGKTVPSGELGHIY